MCCDSAPSQETKKMKRRKEKIAKVFLWNECECRACHSNCTMGFYWCMYVYALWQRILGVWVCVSDFPFLIYPPIAFVGFTFLLVCRVCVCVHVKVVLCREYWIHFAPLFMSPNVVVVGCLFLSFTSQSWIGSPPCLLDWEQNIFSTHISLSLSLFPHSFSRDFHCLCLCLVLLSLLPIFSHCVGSQRVT